MSSEPLVQLHNPILDILTGQDAPIEWLVPDLLAAGTMVLLVGEASAGKSTLSYNLCLALSCGRPVLGIPTQPRRILYFDQENSQPDRNGYLRWAYFGHGTPPLDLIGQNFWTSHFELGVPNWFDKAKLLVEAVQPHLIVFDTASPCFDIQDEDSNSEANRAVRKIRTLMKVPAKPACALILKHAKFESEGPVRTIRGAKDWLGQADSVLYHLVVGPPRPNGLRPTAIQPRKTRVFGPRDTIAVRAEWTDPAKRGLILTAG